MINQPNIEFNESSDKENKISSNTPLIEIIEDNNTEKEPDKSKEEKHYENISTFLDELNYMIDDVVDLGEDYEKYKKVFSDLRNELKDKYDNYSEKKVFILKLIRIKNHLIVHRI